jgi:putative holliday junction resolvase
MVENSDSRVMALDFGMKRIGVALSDQLKMFAYAHTTVNNDEKAFNNLSEIIKEKFVSEIVLGIPNENRISKTSIVENIKKFKSELEQRFGLKVILWDETFTSSIAQQRVIESVNKKQKRKNKELLDMHSAAIILQEYLDSIKS